MTDTLETIEMEGGNTKKPPPSSQTTQCMHWCFTWNNYEQADIETLETLFKHLCHKYCFQEETGENGTPHLQGVISMKKRARWSEFGLPKQIHWEKCLNVTRSYIYCSKEETRTGNIFAFNYDVPEPLKLINPTKQWQKNILDIIKNVPDERTVHWYWEPTGGVGKSSFAKYLVAKHNALFFEEGKKSDIMHLIMTAPLSRLKLIIIDVPRDNGNNVSYKSIESIKNGMIYSPKYEGGYKLFNSPHVVIFANEPPQFDRMSFDRWHVVNISDIIEPEYTGMFPITHYCN